MTERYRLTLVREPSTYPAGEQIVAPAGFAKISTEILESEPQEIVLCLHLDRRHRIRGYQEVSRGGLDNAQVDLRVLFAGILVAGTPAFAIAHNHPSGDPTPSPDDIALTRRVARAAELLGIEFLDHVVVATNGWTSLVQQGAL
jgi:DNA repair protein RadC